MNTYIIVFTNGTIAEIEADSVESIDSREYVRFYKGNEIVARINMSNIVGWINSKNYGGKQR